MQVLEERLKKKRPNLHGNLMPHYTHVFAVVWNIEWKGELIVSIGVEHCLYSHPSANWIANGNANKLR